MGEEKPVIREGEEKKGEESREDEPSEEVQNDEGDDEDDEGMETDDQEGDHTGEDDDVSDEDGEKKEGDEDKAKNTTSSAEEAAPKKKKYANLPMKDIKEPHDHDVLYGRGGGTNHHPGNKRYRKMVEDRKLDYVNSKRLDKPLVALEIIKYWRGQDPPGRFLKLDEKTGLWHDVGDKKAREKTSQALREKAPEIRRKQEEEDLIKQGKDPKEVMKEREEAAKVLKEREETAKKTARFADGTKDKQRDQSKHAILARDHSLGREYMAAGETVDLDGFAWSPAALDRMSSYGSMEGYPPGRITSQGSQGVMPPHFPPSRGPSHSSMGGPPPMPPPHQDYYRGMSQEERNRSYGSIRDFSWSRLPSGGSMPPYPPGAPPPYPPSGFGMPGSRDHSLAHNPLRDASVSQPARTFDSRGASGYWGDPNMPPPPMPYGGGPPPHYMSGEYPPPPYGRLPSGGPPPPPYDPSMSPGGPPRSPPYSVDPAIAKSWSTQSEDYEKVADMFGSELRKSWSADSDTYRNGRLQAKPGTFGPDPYPPADGGLPRPDVVKRMTSNQNEDVETKRDLTGDGRSIKRAALNRDNSMASNRLKEKFAPGAIKKPMALDHEMRMLSASMEQSSLDTKPKPLGLDERSSTIEKIAMELMTKPMPMNASARSSTIEALALELDVDDIETEDDPRIPRPPVLRTAGRMSTAEYFDIVNEPLGIDDDEGPLSLNREASVSEWLSQG